MSAIQATHTITTAPETMLQVLTSTPATVSHRPTLLFIPFWGGSSRTFGALAARLSPDFPLILPTLRGWGASTGPADPAAYKTTDNANDLVAVVTQLRADRTLLAAGLLQHGLILVGHSMGGKIAQVLAARSDFGALLKGVVLIAPAPLGKLEPSAEMREQQIAAYSSKELAERALKHVLLGSDVGVDELRLLVEDCVSGSEFATLAWPKYAIREDYETVASGTEGLKIIAVVGGLDKIETAEIVEDRVVRVWKKAGASVPMVLLEGAGHLIPVEAPQRVEEVIRTFTQ
ncbi:Alpha/Beta hydrolase protein [Mycena metata]|uniref:Alpha/Beta hydrolase protein n=1 Tax=Mycena metata TaxID=1033252 RepID=A0AAD7HII5_9AGAR|nr:Alpha/Beta hydrolase protein [Mycena metata]